MNEISVGDIAICVCELSQKYGLLTIGKEYEVLSVQDGYISVKDNTGEINSYYDERFVLKNKETEMTLTNSMTSEQIRNEILRIDTRIEEAKKDIENAEKERNSLVEKLREKGFELTYRAPTNSRSQKLTVGDVVRITSYDDVYHDRNCVDQTAEVLKVDNSDRPYYVRTESDDYFWCTPEEVEKI